MHSQDIICDVLAPEIFTGYNVQKIIPTYLFHLYFLPGIMAYTELSRQLQGTTHAARKQQLSSALAEIEKQLKALGARPH